ncbi:PEP-CTERM sorting domain-containing protein [Roseateles oligotrophus]|uniref:PEP-CTERM sorting domain-containing protein n=1 Tax=Roseateles oligotrophus TaxID=1769250 RepID=A0ABT2YAX1_9BURK|nr:PEP-CTERM sorting domain-containing protein [Roseateles oligotrophus]MCV2366722.1 PEP-CTERM sorting domain-containing protein [Roseateles oligotrophus]
MRRQSLEISLAAVLGLLGCELALADGTAFTSLGNLKYYVIDTDLNDGISASATFLGLASHMVEAESTEGVTSGGASLPSIAYMDSGNGIVQASLTGGTALDSFALNAAAASTFSYGTARSTIYLNFSLSKNAIFVLSGDASVSAATTIGQTARGPERSDAIAQMEFTQTGSNTRLGSTGVLSAGLHGKAGQVSNSGTILASFQNTSGAEFLLTGYAKSWAQSFVPPTPVPEPSTYATLLAGLGLLVLLQRRRRV